MGMQLDEVHPPLLAQAALVDALEIYSEDARTSFTAASLLGVGEPSLPVAENIKGFDILDLAAALQLQVLHNYLFILPFHYLYPHCSLD